jgi:pilus assembly protein CpaC
MIWNLLVGLLLFGGLAASVRAQEEIPPPGSTSKGLVVPLNQTKDLQLSTKKIIKTVLNSNENIVRAVIKAEDPKTVLLTGLQPGVAKIVVTGSDDKQESFEVTVELDVTYLRNMLRKTVPTANVEPVASANNAIILTGYVAQAEDVDVILKTAASVMGDRIINAMRVGGVMQVQLDVIVASVLRTEFRQMGFAFFETGKVHFLGSTVGVPQSVAATAQTGITNPMGTIVGAPGNLFLGLVNNEQAFYGFLQALRNEGLTKLLDEPKLVTLSGRPASFLSGGKLAVPEPSGLGTTSVRFEDFGTQLNFLPIVLGNGKIHLEVEPIVSAINAANGTSINGTVVPGFDIQRAHTTVEMEDGQTFVIGGLIQTTVNANTSKVPILGDLPFLGTAFRTLSYRESETELVILITPHLVDPATCNQLPAHLPGQETRKADDFELFLEGIMEAPRGPREICPGGRYVPAYKHSPTANTFPCYGNGNGNGHGCGIGGCGANGCGAGGGCAGSPLGMGAMPGVAAQGAGQQGIVPASSRSEMQPAAPTEPNQPAALPLPQGPETGTVPARGSQPAPLPPGLTTPSGKGQ